MSLLHHQNKKMTIIFSIHIAPQRQFSVQTRGRVDNLITRDSRASFCGATLDCMQHWRGERHVGGGDKMLITIIICSISTMSWMETFLSPDVVSVSRLWGDSRSVTGAPGPTRRHSIIFTFSYKLAKTWHLLLLPRLCCWESCSRCSQVLSMRMLKQWIHHHR